MNNNRGNSGLLKQTPNSSSFLLLIAEGGIERNLPGHALHPKNRHSLHASLLRRLRLLQEHLVQEGTQHGGFLRSRGDLVVEGGGVRAQKRGVRAQKRRGVRAQERRGVRADHRRGLHTGQRGRRDLEERRRLQLEERRRLSIERLRHIIAVVLRCIGQRARERFASGVAILISEEVVFLSVKRKQQFGNDSESNTLVFSALLKTANAR